MGRRTKLTDPVQKQIVQLLETGVTIADTCAHVGIAKSTYFDWIRRGEAGEAGYSDFSDGVSRAHGAAKVKAIETLRAAMSPYNTTRTTTETFTETRMKRDGTPYEYTRVRKSRTVERMLGDWHAALEYLKRRFRDEWGDRIEIDWKQELLKAGMNPDAELERLTAEFERHLLAGGAGADAGSLDAGAGAGAGEADAS
jgi:transposase-like protein